MKKITTLTYIALLSLGLNAQSLLPIKFGIKAGSNITNITSTPNEGTKNIETTELIGVAGGFYVEIPLNNKWYINPEIVYSQKGANFTYSYTHDYEVNQRDIHTTSHELKLAYVELNPNISYKYSTKLSLNFGPSLAYLLSSEYNILADNGGDDTDILYEVLPDGIYEEDTLDVGINLGISYYLTDNFLLDMKSNTGLMSIGEVSKMIYTGSNENLPKSNIYNLKNRSVVFSIAYLF